MNQSSSTVRGTKYSSVPIRKKKKRWTWNWKQIYHWSFEKFWIVMREIVFSVTPGNIGSESRNTSTYFQRSCAEPVTRRCEIWHVLLVVRHMKHATERLLAGYSELMCVACAACETVRMIYSVSLPDWQLQESSLKITPQIRPSCPIKVIKDWRTLLDAVV